MTTINIEEKIRKLLALGERAGTEAEAAAAMSAAHRLLAQHNLDMQTVQAGGMEKEEGIETDKTTESKLSNTQPIDYIYAAVGKLYFCKVYTSKRRVDGEFVRSVCIMGRPSNIAIVKYVAAYMVRSMEEQAQRQGKAALQELAREGGVLNVRLWRSSFRLGFALRVSNRVEDEIKQANAGTIVSDGRALALAPLYNKEASAIAKYMADSKMKLASSRSKCSVRSTSGYDAGQAAGERAALRSNGLTGSTGHKQLA